MNYSQDNISLIASLAVFMDRHGGVDRTWFVGITGNAEVGSERHGLQDDDPRIFLRTASEEIARTVERAFVFPGLTDGGTNDDEEPHFVYAYRKGPHTNP